MPFKSVHKKIVQCETFGPLKCLNCDPFIFYNFFVIVIFENKKPDDVIKINPNFTIKSATLFKNIILCLDFNNTLHCLTPHPKTKWKQTSFKVLLSDVSNFCVLDDLFVFRRIVDRLILVQYTFASNSFKCLKKAKLKSENILLNNFDVLPCLASSFLLHFREKIFQTSVEDGDKLFFLYAGGKVFWIKFNSEYLNNELQVSLLYEAVLPISNVLALRNEIIVALQCGTLIFVSNGDTAFLNDSIERIAEITENFYAYLAKGNLYTVGVSAYSAIKIKDHNIRNIHSFIIDQKITIISITENNLIHFTSLVPNKNANNGSDEDQFIKFPRELENTRNIVENLKQEVTKSETFIDKIMIEKNLVLLAMLMLEPGVFEKTAKVEAYIRENVVNIPSNFHSFLIFDPYTDLFYKATSHVHIEVDFSLEFKVRFNEINRLLAKHKTNDLSMWTLNVNFESGSYRKQISYHIQNLNNLNFIISVKNADLVLPIRVRAYFVINYMNCHVVLCSACKDFNVFEITSSKLDDTRSLEDDIVSLAMRNVGLLYDFDRGLLSNNHVDFRLALHPNVLQPECSFVKYFPDKFTKDYKVEDFLKGSLPLKCYVGSSEISLEIVKDETKLAYLHISCSNPLLLVEMRKFMLNCFEDIKNKIGNDDHLKLLDDTNCV